MRRLFASGHPGDPVNHPHASGARNLDRVPHLANQQVQPVSIETGLTIVLPAQLKNGESVLVGAKATVDRLVQINEAALDDEKYQSWFWRVIGHNQRVSLAGGFVDEGPGLCNPVMFQVSPVTTHGIATNRANVVVNAELGAGESLQNDAEPTGRDIKAARLQPDPIRIRNPEAVIVLLDVRDKVFAVPSIRIEAVGKTVEGSDWHLPLPCKRTIEKPVSV